MKKIFLLSSALISILLFSCGTVSTSEPTIFPTSSIAPSQTQTTVKPQKLDPIVTRQTSAIKKESFASVTDGPLPYRLYTPSNYDGDAYHYPVFIFLHGSGERGNDNSLQLKNAVQNLYNDLNSPLYQSIAIFPQCPKENNTSDSDLNQWVDTPWKNGNYSIDNVPESNDLKAVLQILETIKSNYSVNEKRIYVMGLSMGGFGTWDLIMRHTELFAGAIPICGGADTAYASKLVDMPNHTIHCANDSEVPYTGTKAMVEAIKDAGGNKIIYEQLSGYGHNVWDYASTKAGLMNWLFRQSL